MSQEPVQFAGRSHRVGDPHLSTWLGALATTVFTRADAPPWLRDLAAAWEGAAGGARVAEPFDVALVAALHPDRAPLLAAVVAQAGQELARQRELLGDQAIATLYGIDSMSQVLALNEACWAILQDPGAPERG